MNTAHRIQQEELLSSRTVPLIFGLCLLLTLLHTVFYQHHLWLWVPMGGFLCVHLMVQQKARNMRPFWLTFTPFVALLVLCTLAALFAGGLASPWLWSWPVVALTIAVLWGRQAVLFTAVGMGLIALVLGFVGVPLPSQTPGLYTWLVLVVNLLISVHIGALLLESHQRTFQWLDQQEDQQRRQEQAIRTSEARNRAILEALPDVVLRVARDGTILDASVGEQTHLPLPAESLVGQNVTRYLEHPFPVQEALSWVLSGAGMQTQELGVVFPQWGERTFESRMVAVNTEHAILFWRDITERKRIENERLRQYEQLKVMDGFARELAGAQLHPQHIFQVTVKHSQRMLGDAAVVFLLQADGTFQTAAMAGAQEHTGPSLHQRSSLQAIELGTAQQHLLPGVTPHQSALVVPLRVQGKPMGTLNVIRAGKEGFTSEEEQLLQILSERTGLICHNAELLADNQRQAELVQQANTELEARIRLRTRELHEANEKLLELTVRDGLTGLYNRRHFDQQLDLELRRIQRSNAPLTLLLCDIDFFKRYNDHYGHVEGDHCLKQVARVLGGVFQRAGDTVARYGGEEFAVILPGTGLEQAEVLAGHLKQALARAHLPHQASEVSGCVTLSVGIVTVCSPFLMQPAELVQAADELLYQSKKAGRNQATIRPYPLVDASSHGVGPDI